MTVLDCIKGRFSVRKYTGQSVLDSDLETILEAARLAQSARNIQEWRFVVVRDPETRRRLVPACRNQTHVGEAPVVIACCGTNTDYIMTCGQHAYSLDVAIAMENMCLTAHELGLGTCWMGAFHEDQVKAILGIPDTVRVVGMLSLGHPDVSAPPKNRRPMREIVMYESWRQNIQV
jgi:nitroreductase